jgi:hypothetical protein
MKRGISPEPSKSDAAAGAALPLTSPPPVDKAAQKKARKLERRRLRAELGVKADHQLQHQVKVSEEERSERKAAKRLRQALARAETQYDSNTRAHSSSVGFHSHMTPAVASRHPFAVTDERDHAETPFEA